MENFIADALVAVIFGFFLVWALQWRQRPKLKLIIIPEGKKDDEFNWLSINIVNQGKTSLKEREINWHIYWPTTWFEKGNFFDTEKYSFESVGKIHINFEEFQHIRDFNKIPSFPEREISILKFRFKKSNDINYLKIRYHFSTIIGLMPRWIWRCCWPTKLQDKKRFPKLNFLPTAEIEHI